MGSKDSIDNISANGDQRSTDHWLLLLMILPCVALILFDRSLWASDPSLYGWQATYIYHHFDGLQDFWQAMIKQVPKPPLLPWLGTFFVPIGKLLGHIETGLLLPIILFQYLSLLMLYKTLRIATGKRTISLLACLMLASSMLFLKMGINFYEQMPLLFAVNWFVYLMVAAPRLRSISIITQLIAATAIILLSKLSGPVLVVLPGLYICWHLIRRPLASYAIQPKDLIYLLLSLVPFVLAIVWYTHNFSEVMAYTKVGYNYHWDGIYATNYLSKLGYWSFYLFIWFGIISSVILVIALGRYTYHWYENKDLSAIKTFSPLLWVAIIEVVVNLLIFASAQQQQNRYLLPLVSYMVIITCYLIAGSKFKWPVAGLYFGIFLQVFIGYFYYYSEEYHAPPLQHNTAQQIARIVLEEPEQRYLLITGEQEIFHTSIQFLAIQQSKAAADNTLDVQSLEFMLTHSNVFADIQKGLDTISTWAPDRIFLLSPTHRKENSRVIDESGKQWQDIILSAYIISDSLERSVDYEPYPVEGLDPMVYMLRRREGE